MASTCASFKTLKIEFIEPAIAPVNGYFVQWRKIGDTAFTPVIPNQFHSPILITGVPACDSIEGNITADCNGSMGNPINFAVTVDKRCRNYTFDGAGSVTFKPCGGTMTENITVAIGDSICAEEGALVTSVGYSIGTYCTL